MTASSMSSCNVELTDPLYRSEGFMMFCYKILPCKKSFRHDWRVCPFAHGDETAKRRDPRIFKYTGVICPDAKKGRSCPRGDDCPCTHSLFEYWLHPTRFKTEICSRGSRCNRPFCFFAHKQSEIRKPNFRVQMQGITCDPTTHHAPLSSPNTKSHLYRTQVPQRSACVMNPMNRAPYLETIPTQLFPSAAKSNLSLEGSSISVPDSGSSCDVDLSAATWNSWMGSDSPRPESTIHHVSQSGCMNQNSMAKSAALRPMFPQIPTSEHNAVDWSIWQPPTATRQGSSAHMPMGYEAVWNPVKQLNASVGMSPRLMETHNAARSLKEPSSNKAADNGYDRDYLLATIRDVYQSMLAGCHQDTQSTAISPLEPPEGQQPRQASFGLTGNATGGFYGSNGTCGLEGLQQQNGCVSSNGIACTNNDPNTFERLMYALLKTDSNPATRYFE